MKRLLMIIDPQIDFISGTLPVPHAAYAMDGLVNYVKRENGKYIYKIVTTDWHPTNHCSFKENDGKWPAHCVQDSDGAKIYPPLWEALCHVPGSVEVFRKGTNTDQEEYSIFQNPIAGVRIKQIIQNLGIERIDLCGIAGDICVLDTLKDGIALLGNSMFHLLEEYSPSIDGGKALKEIIHKLLQ